MYLATLVLRPCGAMQELAREKRQQIASELPGLWADVVQGPGMQVGTPRRETTNSATGRRQLFVGAALDRIPLLHQRRHCNALPHLTTSAGEAYDYVGRCVIYEFHRLVMVPESDHHASVLESGRHVCQASWSPGVLYARCLGARASCMPCVLDSGHARKARCRQGPGAGDAMPQRQGQLGRDVLTNGILG